MPDEPRPSLSPVEGARFRAWVGLLCILGGLLALAGLYFVPIPAGNRDALMLAIGVVLGWGGSVVGHEFGGSVAGQKAAQVAIDKISKP